MKGLDYSCSLCQSGSAISGPDLLLSDFTSPVSVVVADGLDH